MKILWAYLSARRRFILMLGVFCGVFALVLGLYRLPLAAVGYAAALCLFLGAIAAVVDYLDFARTHWQLQQTAREIAVTTEHLPQARGTLERDYQQILQAVLDDRARQTNALNARYADMVDYYTIWVHQIKTPIAAMDLLLQEEGRKDPELLEELQRIEQYADMVLTYLRLDGESTDYVIRVCDLDKLIRAAVRKYASQFIRRRLRLTYEPLNCRVLTDEKWLGFVLEQLLSNALKYTRTGGVTISMPDEKVLCIQDTGIGIAPEDLPRVFERGYTGSIGRESRQATGIGLYLCRRICQNLGHTISASSVVGQGTTICLNLQSADRQWD